MITQIEDFFAKGCGRCARFETPDCSARRWAEGLSALRGICREAGLQEALKWGHPCYRHAGRNIAILGAFRGDFRISFFDAGLLQDPAGLLEKPGPNTRHAEMIRFTDRARVEALSQTLLSYLREAMGYAEAGLKAPRAAEALDWPEELVAALDADPAFAEAFLALTPGRRKSYVINLRGAKAPATRAARIERFRPKILAGKGATER